LLNYTTSIDATKTLAEISSILARHGAKAINTGYENGQPCSVAFVVPTSFGDRPFQLPARIGCVWQTLQAQAKKGKVPPRYATREQAPRVAWRIVKDWIEAQMAIVESGMVGMEEVFLPYMLGPTGQTVFQVMQAQQLALPAPEVDGELVEVE
jgi:hypothetical protein